jgi:hypothetical protein
VPPERIRFFADVVMAFATRCPYREVNFLDLFVQFGTGDRAADRELRRDLFKYASSSTATTR